MNTDESILKQKFSIHLSLKEWFHLQTLVTKQGRKKFKTEFDNILSQHLQNLGLKCWLRCKYNWFREINSQKISSPLWRGLFKCIDKDCKNTFEAKIENIAFQMKTLDTFLSARMSQRVNLFLCFTQASCLGDPIAVLFDYGEKF